LLSETRDALLRFIGGRQRCYQQTFKGPVADEVLRDLALFCRANASTFHEDARLHAVAEGRREVWLRIQNHLRLAPDDLFRLTTGEG
jgi:hypothetical protein